MSPPPTYQPFADEEEDLKRKAEIEDMMRWQRENYFRNEPVQPGPFDLALQRFQERRQVSAEATDPSADAAESDEPGLARAAQVGVDDFEEKQTNHLELPPAIRANMETLPSEKAAVVRIAQKESSDARPRAIIQAKPFVTDGVNRVDQLQGKIAKIRKGQLSWELEDQLNYAAYKTGLGVEVHSGGQAVYGRYNQDWTGSSRHDEGDAGDVKLFEVVNGKRRFLNSDNEADRQRMEDFIRYSVIAGASGIGHGYMGPGTVHVGGGSVKAWREVKENARAAFPWVKQALDDGRAERQKLMKEGWNGLVDTLARGRPLSLKPPQRPSVQPPTRKEREQTFPPPLRLLPGLFDGASARNLDGGTWRHAGGRRR